MPFNSISWIWEYLQLNWIIIASILYVSFMFFNQYFIFICVAYISISQQQEDHYGDMEMNDVISIRHVTTHWGIFIIAADHHHM